MLSYRTHRERFVRYFDKGSDNVGWYYRARAALHTIADRYQWDYGTWVDLVAITSPRLSVKQNLRFAYRTMAGLTLPDEGLASTRAALTHYRNTGLIRGAKTRRFSDALRGSDNVVIVDSWLAKGLSVDPRHARHLSVQGRAEHVIGHMAKERHLTLSDTTACVWAGVIRTLTGKDSVPNYRTEDIGLA